MRKGIYLNDTIHGLVPLSEYEKRIISTIGFNRLHDVYQNSTVYLTFPTNRTKRFEHSIGTMKLCSDMFFYSVLNASEKMLDEMYGIFKKELSDILQEVARNTALCYQKLGGISPDKMPQIEFDKLRHSLIPNNVPEQYQTIHIILIQAIRAAALLHDIGHPPFSHIVEYALKAVYEEYKDKQDPANENTENYLNIMSKYLGEGKKLHEEMGNEISDSILQEVILSINDEDDERYNENLFEVIVFQCVKHIFSEQGSFSFLHRIIDSSLDGDRLDYVTRDSINSGLNSGKIDYKRIINDMQLIVDTKEIFFCIPLKAVNSVEDFIKRRYNIYKDIIYHHRVIKTDYLLEYTVRDLVKKYLESECNNNTHSKVVIPFDISGLWFPLGNTASTQKANALSQWNDSWLMTILKQIFYTEYYRKIKVGTPEYILSQRLSELLRNNKCYYSLIKRSENFKTIDDAVKAALKKNKENIQDKVKDINAISAKYQSSASKDGTAVDIKGTLDFIDEILNTEDRGRGGFVMSFISRRHKAIGISSLKSLIREIVCQETKEIFTNTKLYDTIVVFKDISIGLNWPIYFYDYNEKICTLDEISGIADILRLDSDYLPVFYVYILLKEDDTTIIKQRREELLRNIGGKIGEEIASTVTSILTAQINLMEEKVCVKK